MRRTISTAAATRSDSSCFADPKLENDTIAIRGRMPSSRTKLAVWIAISASARASGSMLTVVSAKKSSSRPGSANM